MRPYLEDEHSPYFVALSEMDELWSRITRRFFQACGVAGLALLAAPLMKALTSYFL